MKDYPWGKGTVEWVYDATANDSDKSFTVPAGKIWLVKTIYVVFATSANAGARAIMVHYMNATPNIVMLINPTLSQVANNTYYYAFYPGAPVDSTAAYVSTPMPEMLLTAGMSVRVWDIMAVDAAADDLTVAICYVEYDA